MVVGLPHHVFFISVSFYCVILINPPFSYHTAHARFLLLHLSHSHLRRGGGAEEARKKHEEEARGEKRRQQTFNKMRHPHFKVMSFNFD